jgi:3-methyladenine DNA glycosylase/8-oxoguanine DNA glycosylase
MISLYNLNPSVKLKSQMLEIATQWGNEKSLATLYLLEYKKQNKV